jgi:WD40 repeat protein
VTYDVHGQLLAATETDGFIRVWDMATGKPVGTLLHADPPGHESTIAFSPGGNQLASYGAGGAQVWTLSTGRHVRLAQSADDYLSQGWIVFSPDGNLIVGGAQSGTVQVWAAATGALADNRLTACLSGNLNAGAVAFSPSEDLAASPGSDGYVHLCATSTGEHVYGSASVAGPDPLAVSPDGRLLAIADENGDIQVQDAASQIAVGAPLAASFSSQETPEPTSSPSFSPNEKLLAVLGIDGYVRVWDVATSQLIGKARVTPGGTDSETAGSEVAFSPDSRLLAIDDAGAAYLWNTVSGTVTDVRIPGGRTSDPLVTALAFSSNGGLLETAGSDSQLRTFDALTGASVGRPVALVGQPADTWYGPVFSSDGRLFAAFSGDNYQIWNTASGQPVGGPITLPDYAFVTSAVFSPDDKYLATAGSDGYLRLWAVTAAAFTEFPLPMAQDLAEWDNDAQDGRGAVAISGNGTTLASDFEGTLNTWRTAAVTDPYRTLCAEVGPPPDYLWTEYAAGEPQTRACAGIPAGPNELALFQDQASKQLPNNSN